jgi:hypothetical protein
MNAHLATPSRGAGVGHTGIAHADVLDAWLGDVTGLRDRPHAIAAEHVVDWNAPVCPVELAYDTAEERLPSGVRAVVREGNRRLMFEARSYEVMLRVAPDRLAQQYELAGQILFEGLPLPGATVRLDRSDPGVATSTDGSGGFRLPPLVHGAYGLKIAVDGAVLSVPPIALR